MLVRTDLAATARTAVDMTLNNDTSAIYDLEFVRGLNATAAAGSTLSAAAWSIPAHGASDNAGYASVSRITIPGYDQTNFYKIGELTGIISAASSIDHDISVRGLTYRSTTAISRVKIAAQSTAKLKTGSRLILIVR